MNRESIQTCHLEKLAFVYLRQSSPTQVKRNTEGEERQRRMHNVIREMGWPEQQIVLLRGDTGNSGGTQHGREEYQRILEGVLADQVGVIGAWELSRLTRDNQDWSQLVRICRLRGVLLADEHRIYDCAIPQDRVLLGIQGAFSEYELAMITERMQQSRRQKAARGELYESFPPGYICRHASVYEKHPDERVQRAIEKVFAAYEHAPSVLQLYRRLLEDGFQLPIVPHGQDWREVKWVTPQYQQLMEMLRNPTYAGIYARGRCKTVTVLDASGHSQKKRRRLTSHEWEVFLENHHEPYVSSETWQQNVQKISANAHFQNAMTKPTPQNGSGLMVGLLRCRRCGHKLHATYRSGKVSYVCRGGDPQRNARGKSCFCFRGSRVEEQLAEIILQAVSPAAFTAATLAADELGNQREQRRQLIVDRMESSRENEARAAREYKSTDETYLTVRQRLAQEWEVALLAVREQENQLARFDQQHPQGLTDDQKHELQHLAADVKRIWHHPSANMTLKKQIVRTLIEEIVVDLEKPQNEIVLIIHWAGGHHTELRSPTHWRTQRTQTSDLKSITKTLGKVLNDDAIANVFNRQKLLMPDGATWTGARVADFREQYRIAQYDVDAQNASGWLTQAQAATYVQISPMSMTRLVQCGIIPAEQPGPGFPTVIKKTDLELPRVKTAISDLKTSKRRPLSQHPNQRNLFSE
jgi:DNA invertase Pin-like site-specific DNA recombinase